ncbi:hypothetical protein C5Y96_26410 [Blastopirellula marina]|uniref:EF-hand domain-containing protein n=1 Tax=Blastopirellula marina TaxID=124 RepID=A0A2S8EYP2_9BACT|nr:MULTISPECIES: hypothetical protein [Pirellulaceae]PQO25040.1 hypothetical protein C5Y96_26410 [Blastopirellula marina]RCS40892.1 hypothetical protein DTL36_26460 [Bremerella cremea]
MVTCLAIVSLILCVSLAIARGPNKQGGPQRGAGDAANGNPQIAAGAANGNAQQANGMGGNMRGQQQNMPTIEQLALALLTQFDADGSNTLDQVELQAALAGLKQMMMQNQAAGGGQQLQLMDAMMPQNQNAMPAGGRGPMGAGAGRGGPVGQAARGGR